jgi:CheY-like chemotaxis protein
LETRRIRLGGEELACAEGTTRPAVGDCARSASLSPIGGVAEPAQPILIVEDNTATRAGLASLLNFSGYTTVTARNAEEALDFLRRGGLVCLIILDLGLPGMDGGAFRATLLGDSALADIPVILYSGQDGSAVPQVFGQVSKTADPDVLLGMVAKVCDKGPLSECASE